MGRAIYALATMDSKGLENAYVAQRIRVAGSKAVTVDLGTLAAPAVSPDIPREAVARCHPQGERHVLGQTDRGQAVTAMSEALVAFLKREHEAGKLAGVIGLGGSGGTALIAPAMRALPIGMPKLMVSTVASGNTKPYVGECDIAMLYSVVDVAGLNAVSRQVLGNAAHAIAGMVQTELPAGERKPTVGLTMFGVTTPCVTQVRAALEAAGFDALTFHATGSGGQAMEKLVESGLIQGVMDITTTEVADEVVGGVFPAGPKRFDAILERQIPYVLSLGALDMVNFGARETVPKAFKDRKLHVHNAQVTLMRTTPAENRACARWIAGKLNKSKAPLILLVPEGGVSLLDAPGQPFHDPEADAALISELEAQLDLTKDRQLRKVPHALNAPEFARALVNAFAEVCRGTALEFKV
ncbi:MAG: hypothetical protein AMXMBFR7_06760 [Planctomycetota bacterium]